MEQITRLLADRENDFPGALLRARDQLLAMVEVAADNGAAFTLLAEVYYWLGVHSEDEAEQAEALAKAVEAGERAVQRAPGSAAANFWYANAMAAHGERRGMMHSRSCLELTEKHGQRALELDEGYSHAAPLRLMGRFYSKLPPAPVGPGDRKKGLALAKRAVELEPEHLHNKLVLADAFLSSRYFDEARVLLEEVLAAPEPDAFRMNHARCRDEAAQILGRLENME